MYAEPPSSLGSESLISLSELPLPNADKELDKLVREADGHSAASLASGYTFGLNVLGDIVLPPGAEAHVDRAQMRALGALYLAADLEPAGLIASAEKLAALVASGAINVDLGATASLLHKFWRNRHNRIDKTERVAFFGSLFGATYGPGQADGYVNAEFEPLMLELCEALYRLNEMSSDQIHGGIAQQSRLRGAVSNLISNLVLVGGGVTAFLATEIIRLLKEALVILKHPHLRGIFMARDIWGVVAGINRLARMRTADSRVFVRRGRAGMTVIVWLADAAEVLMRQNGPIVRLDHQVIPAAVDWLQTSLVISERQGQSAAYPPDQSPGSSDHSPLHAGQWADIGV
ncbi:MAG: hypothetical protein GY792_36275 [Gammaproteobacteria bacterium]|nr:hypothetical protein [Gammaproteobacteria bacterium]